MITKDGNEITTFSIFSQKELHNQEYISKIDEIIEKYNILENENHFISSKEKNHLYIINYALSLEKDNKKLPFDLESLFLNNIILKEDINSYLEKKLISLTSDDSIYFLKDINILAFITTIGSSGNILNSSFDYDIESMSRIFRFYEAYLENLFLEDITLFNLTFETYVILLKTLIQLCTINSIDLIKKDSIPEVIELMTQSINIIKFSIKLNDKHLSKINNIQGRYLYVFTHLEKIDIQKDDLSSTFIKFLPQFSKQEDGFLLSKNNHFGFERDFDYINELLLYKNYSAIFILKLLKKLNTLDKSTYATNPFFRKILSIYYKRFSESNEIEVPKNSELIEKELLSSLLFNYKSDLTFEQLKDYKFVIEDFIISGKAFDNKNLESIYRLLYFTSNLEDFKYAHISQILVQKEQIRNTYHEFFKLAILDLFIGKLQDSKISQDSYELLVKIKDYTMQNIFDSYLHSICSKIFIKIASIFGNNEFDEKNTEELFAIFVLLNEEKTINTIYTKQSLQISSILDIPIESIKKDFLYNFFKERVLEIQNDLKKIINKDFTKEDIITVIKTIFMKKLFLFICKIDITTNNIDFNPSNELELFNMKINSKYTISFSFTKQNEQFFNYIFIISKDFIQESLEELFKESNSMNANFYLDEEHDLLF